MRIIEQNINTIATKTSDVRIPNESTFRIDRSFRGSIIERIMSTNKSNENFHANIRKQRDLSTPNSIEPKPSINTDPLSLQKPNSLHTQPRAGVHCTLAQNAHTPVIIAAHRLASATRGGLWSSTCLPSSPGARPDE